MEEKKQSSAFKTVLLVFGIIFSVILVPGLIVGIPVGGATVALSQSVSQEGIEKMLQEAKLSEKAYQLVMDEVVKEAQKEDTLSPEFLEGMARECVTVEVIDDMVTEFIRCFYSGSEPQVDLSDIADGVKRSMEDIAENGFADFYAACFDGAESRFFSPTFIQSNKATIEQEILGKYSEYSAGSLAELEQMYDAHFGEGEYDKLFDEEIARFESEWKDGILDDFGDEMDNMTADIEQEINQALFESSQDPDVRRVFDILSAISEKKETVKLLAYAIVIAAVLLLLVCYWFGTAGFVVPAVALILGGVLCKLVTLLEGTVLSLVKKEIAANPDAAEFSDIILDICRGIIAPFFAEMSKFGITMIGIGVLLVLCAILRGVLKKNAAVAEEAM